MSMETAGIAAVGQKGNEIISLYVGVATLLLLTGAAFAMGSYFIGISKCKVATYYLSQLVGIVFILIAVILLVFRAASSS